MRWSRTPQAWATERWSTPYSPQAPRREGAPRSGVLDTSARSPPRVAGRSTPRTSRADVRRRGGSCVGAFLAPDRHPAQPTLWLTDHVSDQAENSYLGRDPGFRRAVASNEPRVARNVD